MWCKSYYTDPDCFGGYLEVREEKMMRGDSVLYAVFASVG